MVAVKTILVDAVETFVIEGEGVYAPMHELLERYPHRKIIVTNANDEQMVTYGLVDLPYELFSMKHSPDKTDPLYFKTLLEKYGLHADDVVYFEHNPKAVESAESLGIVSYHYDSKKKDLAALERFLNENAA